MEQKLVQLGSELRQLKLTDDERSRMRHFLSTFMVSKPMAVRSGFVSGFAAFFRLSIVALGVLVLAVGVWQGAERSLPGDVLYGVKTTINESVRGALAISGEEKMSWEVTKLERRQAEAEAIAYEKGI